MTAPSRYPLTQAAFHTWEQRQEAKHEFVGGHVYNFAGGTIEHNALTSLLIEQIGPAARPCRTYGSDMLVEMATSSRYPDIVVTCDERDRVAGSTTIRYPKLIVEVLSDSTAKDDLGPKMREYQAIDTLEEYVTIDSRTRWAQVARRDGNQWTLEQPIVGSGTLELRSVGLYIDLEQLYENAGVS
jgi:Uma2 family endonuclease